MMAGNPSWWSMHPPSQHPSTLLSPTPSLLPSQYVLGSSILPPNSLADNQELPQSWSQLLLGGFSSDEDRFGGLSHFHQPKKLENWEEQILNNPSPRVPVVDVKQEVPQNNNNLYGHGDDNEFQAPRPTWSSQCNNIPTTGGACKKPRVQPSASQPPLKVRKEKLGDRITALHQLVSPFGKTDTASVLLEAIGYIRFLQGQIEALSSPYLGTASANIRNQPNSVQGGGRNCAFAEDPGQDADDKPKDLRSRGLCLVPVSCTQQVGSDNGADYWAPAFGGGF